MTYSPFFIHGADRPSRWLITCDHASNVVPPFVSDGDLGLAAADMERHIAYDIGAYEVSKQLGQLLDAPVIASNFSRLVIDPNRGEDDPTLLMKLYDGTIIPGNRHADEAERQHRLETCHRPYHQALSQLADRDQVVIVSVHSFTRQLRGRAPRPWHIGVLHPQDELFSPVLADHLQAEPDLCVGVNAPYSGYFRGDTIDTHATAHGRANTLIELRNDLIADAKGQQIWAQRLAPILVKTLATSSL